MIRLRTIYFCPLLAIALGCTSVLNDDSQFNQAKQDRFLLIWLSNGVSAARKADAANRLIPVGTDGEVVKKLLGVSARRNRLHGPDIDLTHASTEKEHDFWTLEYPASNGEVIFFLVSSILNLF
jgi:hypothetical protein